jgi:hypothetical protein
MRHDEEQEHLSCENEAFDHDQDARESASCQSMPACSQGQSDATFSGLVAMNAEAVHSEDAGMKSPTTVSGWKKVRGEWMLENIDPVSMNNMDIQDRVNRATAEKGWPLLPFDSDNGNGAFEAYKAAYRKKYQREYVVDRRGRNKLSK